jgi:hypothetical protein
MQNLSHARVIRTSPWHNLRDSSTLGFFTSTGTNFPLTTVGQSAHFAMGLNKIRPPSQMALLLLQRFLYPLHSFLPAHVLLDSQAFESLDRGLAAMSATRRQTAMRLALYLDCIGAKPLLIGNSYKEYCDALRIQYQSIETRTEKGGPDKRPQADSRDCGAG